MSLQCVDVGDPLVDQGLVRLPEAIAVRLQEGVMQIGDLLCERRFLLRRPILIGEEVVLLESLKLAFACLDARSHHRTLHDLAYGLRDVDLLVVLDQAAITQEREQDVVEGFLLTLSL
ncbi:hypothetical protein D3C76_1266670 [compost metagenome]